MKTYLLIGVAVSGGFLLFLAHFLTRDTENKEILQLQQMWQEDIFDIVGYRVPFLILFIINTLCFPFFIATLLFLFVESKKG